MVIESTSVHIAANDIIAIAVAYVKPLDVDIRLLIFKAFSEVEVLPVGVVTLLVAICNKLQVSSTAVVTCDVE